MDNAGENVNALKKMCEENEGIEIELTAPNTPQHNGVVERIFSTDRRRALAMLIAARLKPTTRNVPWAEAVHTAEKLGNVTTNTINLEKSPHELFHGTKPNIMENLIQFGRIGYITIRKIIKGRSTLCQVKYNTVGFGDVSLLWASIWFVFMH